jgi:hypothetical protein
MKRFPLLPLFLAPAVLGLAAPSEADIAKLGVSLTPLGGDASANAEGTIPAYTGGITQPPAGYKVGDHHPDPFADDQPLYTVTAANLAEHESKVTAGHAALLKAYPQSYKLVVYPTRRSASFPQRVYDATKANASTAKLVNNGSGVEGTLVSSPFPLPQDGLEAIWNHLLRFRAEAVTRTVGQAAPLRDGSYTLVELDEDILVNYARPGITAAELNNIILYFRQSVNAPARLAGSILLVHETLDQVKELRNAWVYNPGRRRVTKAPNIAYDNPGTASDNMRTSDQLDMFNGAPDRYEWTLVGKKELIVPYNAYKLHSDQVKVADIIKPLHINQDLARYELHRVWVVEAKLKEGTSHIYPRRTFYLDEDSWHVLAVDQYDSRGQMWRVSEAHCINYYEVPVFWSTLEVHTDLQAGRYLAFGLDNQGKMYDFSVKRTPGNYTPQSLRMEGVR